jgi:hypothetical protein
MRKRLLWLPFVAVLLLLPLATHPGAQISTTQTFKTTFTFPAGNTTFPAGSYEIRPVEGETGVVQILASPGGTPSAFVEVIGAKGKEKPAKSDVVFQKYGDKYLLKTVWDASSGGGVTTVPTHAEKTHAKSGAPTEHHVAAAPKVKS